MDRFTLHSGQLSAEITALGGELLSLKFGDNELIWQGDPAYWEGSAPFLFPFCGRVKDGIYRWKEKNYSMPIHGFLPSSRLTAQTHTATSLTLTLTDSANTRAVYPFAFNLTLHYQLTPSALNITATIEAGDTSLPFSFGGHPGFNLPLTADGFDRANLQFDTSDTLSRLEITELGLLGNKHTDYPLQGNSLPLSPDPAGGCGIFFAVPQTQRAIVLTAPTLPCDIRMEFADFPILGLWHAESSPYLCIEPWQGLPAPDSIPTDLACKPETITLAPHQTKTLTMRICLLQKG